MSTHVHKFVVTLARSSRLHLGVIQIRSECRRVLDLSLFHMVPKSVHLEDFVSLQNQVIEQSRRLSMCSGRGNGMPTFIGRLYRSGWRRIYTFQYFNFCLKAVPMKGAQARLHN